MRLYDILDLPGEKVLYFDGEAEPSVGNFLGDLTNELDGEHIVDFASAGLKNFAHCTSDGDTCCKVKGFTLNHENAKK